MSKEVFLGCRLNSKNLFTKSKFKRDLHAVTSNEEKYPAQSELLRIAEASFNAKKSEVINKHINKKLQEVPSKYRKIEKTLSLIEVLLEHGSRKCVFEIQNKLFLIKNLENFQYVKDKKNLGAKSELISPGSGGHSPTADPRHQP